MFSSVRGRPISSTAFLFNPVGKRFVFKPLRFHDVLDKSAASDIFSGIL